MLGINKLVYFVMVDLLLLLLISRGLCCFKSWLNLLKCCFFNLLVYYIFQFSCWFADEFFQ